MTARVRANLSPLMVRSAERFAQRAKEIEEHHESWGSPQVEDLWENVVMAVIASATTLDARINELSDDAANDERRQTLEKYQAVLRSAGADEFDKGKDPYQSTNWLLELRHALIHFQPSWADDEPPMRIQKLEGALANKFPACTLLPAGQGPWWPNRAISAGCAEWSVKTARNFIDEFGRRMGIKGL